MTDGSKALVQIDVAIGANFQPVNNIHTVLDGLPLLLAQMIVRDAVRQVEALRKARAENPEAGEQYFDSLTGEQTQDQINLVFDPEAHSFVVVLSGTNNAAFWRTRLPFAQALLEELGMELQEQRVRINMLQARKEMADAERANAIARSVSGAGLRS